MNDRNSEHISLSVVIPFKDKSRLTIDCVGSLIKYGPDVESITLISNNSYKGELRAVREETSSMPNVEVVEYNEPFNYQKINNFAAKKAKTKAVLFLNNDTELTLSSKGLLEDMYRKCLKDDVGSVGCVLLYEDKTIQHAGVYLVPGGMAAHDLIREDYEVVTKSDYLQKDRQVTAVTGAAMMIERRKYQEISGFNENFVIGGGDVDICIRLAQKGYNSWVVSPRKTIVHKEKVSRKKFTLPYSDYYFSYKSYIKAFNLDKGDVYHNKLMSHRKES